MSWVVGFTGDQSVSLDAALRGAGMGPPLHRVHCGGTMLLAGGLPETCLLIDSVDRSEGEVQHLVLGLGLMAARGQRATSLMTTGDWAEVLRLENAPLPPAGHFLVLTIRPNGVTVVNDRLGLRTIYMREWKG